MDHVTPKPTLLVVDDDLPVLELMQQGLGASGYAVVLAENAADALARYDPKAIDAVITDIQMPGLDGVQLCLELRARARAAGRELPVWLMTGARNADTIRRADEAGAEAVLWKPFSVAEVRAALETRLGGAANR